MGHDGRVADSAGGAGSEALEDDGMRRVAVTTVAAAGIAWWPAFTLGAYGAVFFEQLLTLWAVATSVFLVAAATLRRRLVRRPAWWALLLPSLWLLATLVLPPSGDSVAYSLLFWFGVAVTVVGAPAMAAVLVRLILPGAARLDRGQAWVAVGVVGTVMATSYLLGVVNPRFLTCEDFTISGNFAPPGCTPGSGTTVR
jgi:hypothetical protein